jgi:hypothetical protein
MSGWMLFDTDPVTGRKVYLTEQDGQFYAMVEQPLQDIFDANHDAEMASHGKPFGDWVRAASMPHHLVYHNGINDAVIQKDRKHLARVLNDSDNQKFRTSRGRV